ncbi:MAG: hypothetical protein ACLPTQ_08245 [Terriglobales bacterium]
MKKKKKNGATSKTAAEVSPPVERVEIVCAYVPSVLIRPLTKQQDRQETLYEKRLQRNAKNGKLNVQILGTHFFITPPSRPNNIHCCHLCTLKTHRESAATVAREAEAREALRVLKLSGDYFRLKTIDKDGGTAATESPELKEEKERSTYGNKKAKMTYGKNVVKICKRAVGQAAVTRKAYVTVSQVEIETDVEFSKVSDREIDLTTGNKFEKAKLPDDFQVNQFSYEKNPDGVGVRFVTYGASPRYVLQADGTYKKVKAAKARRSIKDIPLFKFFKNPVRREEEYQKYLKRLERKAKKNEAYFAALKESGTENPATPPTREFYKPSVNPKLVGAHGKRHVLGGDVQIATGITGRVTLASTSPFENPETVLVPTTGRTVEELPSYLQQTNENVTAVIPAVKKRRKKKV